MNLLQNLIKIVSLCSILACLISTACTTQPALQNKQISASPSPISNQMPPKTTKPMPPLVASHGGQAEKNLAGNTILSWNLIDGSTKNFAAYRGKAIVLDFWATYCPPCEEEIPHLVELSGKYKTDLQIVGLHVGGAEDKSNIANFVAKYRMTYDLGYPEQALTDFYLQGDDRIPQTLVFDRRGNLVQKFVGFTPEMKIELDNAVQTAIAQ